MKREEAPASKVAEWVLTASAMVLKIAAVVFVLDATYLTYVVLSGQLATAAPGATAALAFFGRILFAAGVLATLTLALLTLEEVYWSLIAGAVGVVLLLGVPGMVANAGLGGPVPEAAKVVAWWGTLTGKAMILIVACRIIYEIYLQASLGNLRKRLKEDEIAKGRRKLVKVPKENVFAKCWQMPFCHDAVRELCPAFKAKKPCWRYGRGCNCDPDLVETLIASRAAGPQRGARDSEGAFLRAEFEVDTPKKSRSEKTIPCAKCPIYTEHQRRKFKVINPILIVLTVVLIAFFYTPLAGLYSSLAQGIAGMISGTGLSTTGNVQTQEWWIEYLDTPALQGAFVVILGLFCLSWILKLGEWLVLDRKLV